MIEIFLEKNSVRIFLKQLARWHLAAPLALVKEAVIVS